MQNVLGGGWRVSLTLWLSLLYLFGHFIKDSFPCGCIFTVPLACVRLLDGLWVVCWLCASVPAVCRKWPWGLTLEAAGTQGR